jgi:hypothetical protein
MAVLPDRNEFAVVTEPSVRTTLKVPATAGAGTEPAG